MPTADLSTRRPRSTRQTSDADRRVDDEFADEDERRDDRSRMSFLEHLDELRRRILYSLYALIASCVGHVLLLGHAVSRTSSTYFSAATAAQLIFTQPMAGFMFSLKIGAAAGAHRRVAVRLLAVVAVRRARALRAREEASSIPFVLFSTLLFVAGAWFAPLRRVPDRCGSSSRATSIDGVQFMPDARRHVLVLREDDPRPRPGVPDADARVLPGAVRHRDGRVHAAASSSTRFSSSSSSRRSSRRARDIGHAAACLPRRCWCSTSSASSWPGCSARTKKTED